MNIKNISPPFSWIGHIPFSFYLVDKLKPEVIVELGTHKGNSFFSFCDASIQSKTNTIVYAIDLWKGDPQAGFYGEEIFRELNNVVQENYLGRGVLVRKDFNEAVNEFKENSIDVLHIDGFHSYEAVKNDFETWFPKLKKNAIVLFHDTEVLKEGFGVHLYWEELKLKYKYHFNFKFSYGLGVLSINNEVQNPLLKELNENETLVKLFEKNSDYFFEMENLKLNYKFLLKKYNRIQNLRIFKFIKFIKSKFTF